MNRLSSKEVAAERQQPSRPWIRATLASAALFLTGCDAVEGSDQKCAPYQVYAQNRWSPLGASLRENPSINSERVGSKNGNEQITIIGWKHTGQPAYPNNQAPWNSDVWLKTDEGTWVTFAAVRDELTTPDPTGLADGGEPALLASNCEID